MSMATLVVNRHQTDCKASVVIMRTISMTSGKNPVMFRIDATSFMLAWIMVEFKMKLNIFGKKFSFQFLHQNLHLNEPPPTSKESSSQPLSAKKIVILPFKIFSLSLVVQNENYRTEGP